MGQALQLSFLLATIAFFGSLLVTISLALAIAYFRGTYIDGWGTFLCVLMMSIVYLVYIIAGQFLLGKLLKIFPLAGYYSWSTGVEIRHATRRRQHRRRSWCDGPVCIGHFSR